MTITSMLIIMNNYDDRSSFIMAMMIKRNTLSCLTAFLRLFLLRRALQPRSSPCPMRPSRPDHHHDEEADDDGKDGIDDKNGQIDKNEFKELLKKVNPQLERSDQVDEYFDRFNVDDRGSPNCLDQTEFIQFCKEFRASIFK